MLPDATDTKASCGSRPPFVQGQALWSSRLNFRLCPVEKNNGFFSGQVSRHVNKPVDIARVVINCFRP